VQSTYVILRYLSFLYLFCSDVLKFNSLKPSVKCLNRSASVTLIVRLCSLWQRFVFYVSQLRFVHE